MKIVSEKFRDALNGIRELDLVITYSGANGYYILTTENSNYLVTENDYKIATQKGIETITRESIKNFHYAFNGGLFKTICKYVELELTESIPRNTRFEVKVGVNVDGEYEYVSLGYFYTIEESEYQLDTELYKVTAYDRMVDLMRVLKYSEFLPTDGDISFDFGDGGFVFADHYYPQLLIPMIIKNVNDTTTLDSEHPIKYNLPRTFTNITAELSIDGFVNRIDITARDVLDDLCEYCGLALYFNEEEILTFKQFQGSIEYKKIANTNVNNIEIQDGLNRNVYTNVLSGKCEQDGTPTPTEPVEIKTVGKIINDTNKIIETTTNGTNTNSIEVSLNKTNLLDLNSFVKGRLDNGVLGYESDTTDLTVTGNTISFTIAKTWRGVVSEYIKIDKDLILVSDNLGSTYSASVSCYDENKGFISTSQIVGTGTVKYKRVKIAANTKYVRVYLYSGTVGTTTISNLKMYTGYNPETYYELASIDSTRDAYNFILGKYFKKVDTITLNGNESWTLLSAGRFYSSVIENSVLKPSTNDDKVGLLSNCFEETTRNDIGNVANGIAIETTGKIFIKVNSTMSSVDELKTWLSNNPVKVYFKLNEQQEISYTSQDFKLYDNYNKISIDSELAPTLLTIGYYAGIIDYKIDDTTLRNTNVKTSRHYGPVNSLVIKDGNDTILASETNSESITANGKTELIIKDNLFYVNSVSEEELETDAHNMFELINGLEYDILDIETTGELVLEPLDNIRVDYKDQVWYSIIFNNEINMELGLTEQIYIDLPDENSSEYVSNFDSNGKTIDVSSMYTELQQLRTLVNEMQISLNSLKGDD